MVSDWEYLSLRDVIEQVADNRGRNPKSYSETGIPVIDNYLIISEGYVNLNNVKRYIDESTYKSFIRKYIKHNDVLITLVGNGYGQVALTPLKKSIIIQNTIGLRCNLKNDNKFLYYLLKNNRLSMMNLNIGAAQPSIKVGDLMGLEFRFPDLLEQKAIAHILGTLDDKIELNRQMNETLEAMAQALFKSWFVDFDPVIDNALLAGKAIPEPLREQAEMRQAQLDSGKANTNSEINDLFPSEFEFTEELGWIPKGWKVSNINNEFEVTMGQSPPGSSYNEEQEGIAFFQGSTDFGFRYPTNRIYTTEPKRLADKDDTLVSVRAPVGTVNMATQKCCIGRGLSAVRHKSGNRSYTYYSMIQLHQKFQVFESQGTVFGSINQKDFKALLQIRAPDSLINKFEEYSGSLDNKIETNTLQITALAKLRDTLLPKLMSGELRIPDAEKLLSDI